MTRYPDARSVEEQWVATGRRLTKSQSELQFILGDLALEVLPLPRRGGRIPPQEYEILAMFAEKLGMSRERLEDYRRVSAAWPREHRVEGVSWSVHAILSHHADRFQAIKAPPVDPRTGERHWTCDTANAVLGRQARRGRTR